jgi:peptide/nickel transport system substrate-binding protein
MATRRGTINRRRFVIGAGALAGALVGTRMADARVTQDDGTTTFASQIDTANITPGGVIIEGGVSEVRLLNTILSGDSTTQRALSLIHDGLVLVDPDTTLPVPNLAESWEVSADGLTYTFALKQGVKFHDGQPFTSQDVKFTYEAAMNPDTTSVRAGILNQRIKAIEAPDDADARPARGGHRPEDGADRLPGSSRRCRGDRPIARRPRPRA